MVSSGFATLVGLACEVAVVVVVATVVKRHRPDAYGTLLAWAIGSLVVTIAFAVAYPVTAKLVPASAGVDGYLTALAILGFVRAAVSVALLVVFIRGLVALAEPPRPLVVPSDAPYR